MAKNATCKVRISGRAVKGSCELINGVMFERLTVSKKDSMGMPAEYTVTERFSCFNPGVEGGQKYWPDKLYFKKVNGHYRWEADTVDVSYRVNGYSRDMVSARKKPGNYNDQFILASTKYDTCPLSFGASTWYYVSISDQRLRNVYLYVDKKDRFHVYQFNSGLSPI